MIQLKNSISTQCHSSLSGKYEVGSQLAQHKTGIWQQLCVRLFLGFEPFRSDFSSYLISSGRRRAVLFWGPAVLSGSHWAAHYLLPRSRSLWSAVESEPNGNEWIWSIQISQMLMWPQNIFNVRYLKYSNLIYSIYWTRLILPSTRPAAAAAQPAAGRCTSSSQCQRACGQRGWWCCSLAAIAQVWTACRHQSIPHWSSVHGCLALKQSVFGEKKHQMLLRLYGFRWKKVP